MWNVCDCVFLSCRVMKCRLNSRKVKICYHRVVVFIVIIVMVMGMDIDVVMGAVLVVGMIVMIAMGS